MSSPLLKKTFAGSPASAFNPQTDITWHSLFWAEGTAMTALGYADTDAVTTWPNETGEADATSVTGTVTYDAVNTPLNGQPAVQFAAGAGIATASFSAAQTATYSIVFIFDQQYTGIATKSNLSQTTGELIWSQARPISTILYRIRNGGTLLYNTTAVAAGAIMIAGVLGTSGKIIIDGTQEGTANTGTVSLSNLSIGALGEVKAIAFVGIYPGDFTADGNYAAFTSWAETHYGLTIA